ncbi:hypothetical protein FRB95_010517 [Tulasnella sp. JGI-2019a]|nr:hypothetical protein FRB95_010517 [Tulasnella sp. JGI-2019a]
MASMMRPEARGDIPLALGPELRNAPIRGQVSYHESRRAMAAETLRQHLEVYSLADEKKTSVNSDIKAFLKEELPELVSPLVEDASDWPGDQKRKALVLKCQGLFISASTAVRIIVDPDIGRDPDAALERIPSSDRHSHLDEIYRQIIERCGALVVVREPINITTLASLLCSDGQQVREFISLIRLRVLRYLQAVLIIPGVNSIVQAVNAQPIQFMYTSFVDYLTDMARFESRLLIHLPSQHERLAIACFRLMQGLKRNICDLDPSLLNSEVKDLNQRIRERIPSALRCKQHRHPHFSSEFRQREPDVLAGNLSLMGITHEVVGMVVSIESWLKAPSAELTSARLDERSLLLIADSCLKPDALTVPLLYDFRRFIVEFMDPIVESTPHFYLSALALMPSETELSCQYGHLAEDGVRVVRRRAKQWSRTLWTATKHTDSISAVAMFPDGMTIVSGFRDKTLRLWDAKTGAAIGQAMQGHVS